MVKFKMKTTRRIKGRTYHMVFPDEQTNYKKPLSLSLAKKLASEERETTRLARVIKIPGGYGVFVSLNIWLK